MQDNADPVLRLNLKGHGKTITALKFRNQDELISSSSDNNLFMWHIATPDVRTYKFSQHTAAINDLDCTRTGKIIASCSNDMFIRLWLPSLMGGTHAIKAHMKAITSINFLYNGRRLLSASKDKNIKLWDVQNLKFLHSMIGHNHFVNCVRYSDDGSVAISAAEDKTIKIWDTANQQCIHTFINKVSSNHIAIFGKYVACAMQSGSIRIYDFKERKVIQHYHINDNVTCIDWHPTGKYLLASGTNGSSSIIDILEGRPLYRLHGLGGAITSIAYSPTGDTLAFAGENKHILIWDWNTIKNEPIDSASSSVSSVYYSTVSHVSSEVY